MAWCLFFFSSTTEFVDWPLLNKSLAFKFACFCTSVKKTLKKWCSAVNSMNTAILGIFTTGDQRSTDNPDWPTYNTNFAFSFSETLSNILLPTSQVFQKARRGGVIKSREKICICERISETLQMSSNVSNVM